METRLSGLALTNEAVPLAKVETGSCSCACVSEFPSLRSHSAALLGQSLRQLATRKTDQCTRWIRFGRSDYRTNGACSRLLTSILTRRITSGRSIAPMMPGQTSWALQQLRHALNAASWAP